MRGWIAIGALLAMSCGEPASRGGAGDESDPVVDVGEGLEIDTSEDPKEVRRSGELVGVLPGDFPRELPVHLPASVVELAGSSVTLLTPSSPSAVRADLVGRLEAGGWSVSTEAGETITTQRAGRSARLRFEAANPGTRYTWEW